MTGGCYASLYAVTPSLSVRQKQLANNGNHFFFGNAYRSCVGDFTRKSFPNVSKAERGGRRPVFALPHETALTRNRLDKAVGLEFFVCGLYCYDTYSKLASDKTNGRKALALLYFAACYAANDLRVHLLVQRRGYIRIYNYLHSTYNKP